MKSFIGAVLFICVAFSANAQLLWKVSGKGLEKPSYIFGTYHLSPLSIKDSIAAMPQAMSETAQIKRQPHNITTRLFIFTSINDRQR